jgi:hypothetical protein
MPIQSRLIDGIIYTEVSGEINYDLVVKQKNFILSLKDKIVNRYELHDHTNTDSINLSFEEISNISTHSPKTEDVFQVSFLAIYAPNEVTYGIARMFVALYELRGHTINVSIFKNKEEAVKFLKTNQNKYG